MAGACAAQTASRPSIGPRDENQGYEYRIRAENELGVSLLVQQQPGFRFSVEIRAGGGAKVVSQGACAALDGVLADFATLPPLAMGPWSLRNLGEDPPTNLPPRRFHTPWWNVEWSGEAPDGSKSRVIMDGNQGPHSAWLDQVAVAVAACE